MINKIKSFFSKPKKSKKIVVSRGYKVIKPTDYIKLDKIEVVKKACFDYSQFATPFTAKMIWKYLNGLVTIDEVYETMKYLKQNGFLKKITVLASDYEKQKYRMFYALNKIKKDEKIEVKI
jgi:hypothetical protein